MNPLRHLAVVACLVLASTACAPSSLRALTVGSTPDANGSNATRVDVVLAYDDAAAGALPSSSGQWFSDRAQWTAVHGSRARVVSLEVPPGSVMSPVALPSGHAQAKRVVAYVSWNSPGADAPIELTSMHCAVIALEARQFQAVDCP